MHQNQNQEKQRSSFQAGLHLSFLQ